MQKNINPETGLLGPSDLNDPDILSRQVQFSYHLFPMFYYDGWENPYKEKVIDHVLKTQNRLGGYGVALNTSACEDIDSIELLVRLSKQTDYRKADVEISIKRALPWVLSNMNKDGGYYFRKNQGFFYGHEQMSSGENESNMFATWFRTLSLAYVWKYFNPNTDGYNMNQCPGLEFWYP